MIKLLGSSELLISYIFENGCIFLLEKVHRQKQNKNVNILFHELKIRFVLMIHARQTQHKFVFIFNVFMITLIQI